MLNGLDLFSGIGGIAYALRGYVKPVLYCEIEQYPRAVLFSRMQSGELPIAPIASNVRHLKGEPLRGIVDIITGGFPCQDLSVAGNGAGLEGKRSGLFFEIIRIASECRPRFIFLENVPALSIRGLDRVLLELHALGYDARWTIVSAAEMGAPHLRERIWILAHDNSVRGREKQDQKPRSSGSSASFDNGSTKYMASDSARRRILNKEQSSLADSDNSRERQPAISGQKQRIRIADGCEADANSYGLGGREGRHGKNLRRWQPNANGGSEYNPKHWSIEPNVVRLVHGLPFRVERIKGLGNSVVPQVAKEAFERLMGLKETKTKETRWT